MPSKNTQDIFTFTFQDPSFHANSSRKAHILRLNDLLHVSIERGDMARARRAWSILARCKEYDWKRDWRTPLLLLKGDISTSASKYERELSFLKKTMRHHPEESEAILQEITLCMAEVGDFRGALDELDLYLSAFPYQNNAELHCYAGLMSLYLSQSETRRSTQLINGRELLQKSLEYIDKALLIDSENAVAKATKDETAAQLLQANMTTAHLSTNAQSDEEMDTEVDRSDNRTRAKRLRNLTEALSTD